MQKVLIFIAFGSIVVSFFLLIVVGFWLLYPYKVITFQDEYLPVVNKVVPAGGQLQFIANSCKHMDLPAKISRTLIDSIIYTLPNQITASTVLGCKQLMVTIDIANVIPPGQYRLKNTYEYKVNPLRTITIVKETESFMIVKLPTK